MPLLGYAIGSDPANRTITLNHHSKMKNLCDTFRVDDQVAFEKYVGKFRSSGAMMGVLYSSLSIA